MSRRQRLGLVPATLLTLTAAAIAGDPDATVTFVGGPGSEIDGLSVGEFIVPAPERDRLSIAADGGVLFTASIENLLGEVRSPEALIVGRPGSLRLLTGVNSRITATSAPDLDEFVVAAIQHARMTRTGDVVLECTTTDGLFFLPTLLTNVGGVEDVGAVEFYPFGGTCELGEIGDGIFAQPFALNGGVLTFSGSTRLDLCGDNRLRTYRRPATQDAVVLLAEDGGVPETADEVFEGLFYGPVANEDGDALIAARYRGDPRVVNVLVLLPIDGQPTLAATSGINVPGSAEEIVHLGPWTIGKDTGVGVPRVTYVAAAEIDPATIASGDTLHVFDSVAGTDPILSTGDAVAGLSFESRVFGGSTLRLATYETNGIVVVGDVAGDGITGGPVPAVIRYDPDRDAKFDVPLRDGGSIPGSTDLRTIARLRTVHVNAFGILAAEVELSDGSQAILLERAGAAEAGTFAVAVETGEQVSIGDGTALLVEILNQIPKTPVLTRSGGDSLQSRFSERFEFVFRGAVDFGSGLAESGVWTVTIETPPDVCDVDVEVQKGALVIRGGKGNCDITVDSSKGGIVAVRPGENTTVNGSANSWSGEFSKGIDIRMGGGDDRVVVMSSASGDDSPDVFRNLTIDGGFGRDSITVRDLRVDGSVVIRPGDGLQENVTLQSCDVVRNLTIAAAKGRAITRLTSVNVEGKVKIGSGDGFESEVTLESCDMARGARVRGGRSVDTLRVSGSQFGASLSLDPGESDVDFVVLQGVQLEQGDLAVKAKRSRILHLNITSVNVNDGNAKLQVGSRGSEVNVTSLAVEGSVSLKTSGATGAADVHNVNFSALRADHFALSSVGANNLAISGNSELERGIVLKSKKSDLDIFGLDQTRVESGKITVKSGAGALEFRLNRVTLTRGSVVIRGTNGVDRFAFLTSTIVGGVKVAGRGGDDAFDVRATAITGDRVFDGGPGTNTLSVDVASTVDGQDIRKNIEP